MQARLGFADHMPMNHHHTFGYQDFIHGAHDYVLNVLHVLHRCDKVSSTTNDLFNGLMEDSKQGLEKAIIQGLAEIKEEIQQGRENEEEERSWLVLACMLTQLFVPHSMLVQNKDNVCLIPARALEHDVLYPGL